MSAGCSGAPNLYRRYSRSLGSNNPVGKTQLWDVDSGESFSVIVPPEIEGVKFFC
jgi:hypothetical protein